MAVNKDIRILVVDDYKPMRNVIVETLVMLKFTNVDDAENGVVALEKMNAGKVDLVISDLTMPEMDGLEFLKAIKASEQLRDTPVIMLTAVAAQEKVVKAIQAGAANYIVKPITVKALKEQIEKIFNSAS